MTDHVPCIVGMPGSPYSRKLRAVLRYRRIPHVWVHQGSREARGLPQARVALLPQLILRGPDGAPEAAIPYQAKCLRWLREGHAALAPADRRAVDGLLRGTGCERIFTK